MATSSNMSSATVSSAAQVIEVTLGFWPAMGSMNIAQDMQAAIKTTSV